MRSARNVEASDRVPRREFLKAGAAMIAAIPGGRDLIQDASAPTRKAKSRSRLILLGTAGGPTPKPNRAAPAQVIVVDDVAYVVDCGNGVARQLVLAKLRLGAVRHVFLTHHHSDHNADYGNLLLLAWATDLTTRVDTWGPPPLAEMTKLFLELNAYDIRTRIADEGRPPLAPLIRPHEIDRRRGRDAGRARQSHGRAGRASARRSRIRLPLRLPRPLDRDLRRHAALKGPGQARAGRRRARARGHARRRRWIASSRPSRMRRRCARTCSRATRRPNRSAASPQKRG